MITIYFNAKPLYLCNSIDPRIDDYLHRPETMFFDTLNDHSVRAMIYEMQQDNIYTGVFIHQDLNELVDAFKKAFSLVLAAGGFVLSDDQVLLIFRRGKWDLPKGKLDEGEDLETCAIREVQEETGLQNVSISRPLIITYHTYHELEQFILKESHWYLMNAVHHGDLTPQQEEGIEQCRWVPLKALDPFLDNTHPSIKDVVEQAVRIVK